MDKEDVVHTSTTECYSAIEKNEIMPLAAPWMSLEIIILSEVNQRQVSYDVTCVESVTQMNLLAEQKQTHRHRAQTCGYQRGNV